MTMVLVAIAMVAIVAMAALSIDVVVLYLAREEAQRSADASALAAARVISLSGMTGDPNNSASSWQAICGGSGSPATQTATAVATQNAVGRAAADTVNVTYSAGGSSGSNCSSLPAAFGVNPMVTVQVIRASLPTFFSRIWGNKGNTVSATATAEAFNPSNSGNVGNQPTRTIIPVQPRCVKPWIVPNLDPLNPNTSCTSGGNSCQPFVDSGDGHIVNPGISLNGTNSGGVIGERFLLIPNCHHRITGSCSLRSTPIQANSPRNGNTVPNSPNLEFLPGQSENASVAVPSAASAGTLFEKAIAGCDQTTVYYCGVSSSSPIGSGPNMVDLRIYPADDTTNGVQALINEGNPNPSGGQPTGQDYFNQSASPYGNPSAYPFQILAGSSNPLPGLAAGVPITSSNSIVSLPIYDRANPIATTGTSPVTIVGFLQVFINGVDQYGNIDVVVLNVAGCSNGGGQPVGTAVTGSSPVPVRLITPP
jgi:hypothetical protein